MKLRKSIMAVTTAATVLFGAGVVSTAIPAWAEEKPASNAAPCPDNNWKDDSGTGKAFNADGVRIRTGPSTSCTVKGLGYRSHNVTVHCQKQIADQLWSHIRDNTTGVSGWVASEYLNWSGVPCWY